MTVTTIKQPTPSYNNFQVWHTGLKMNAKEILEKKHLAAPSDPAQIQTQEKKVNRIKGLILQSIPEEIVMKLVSLFLENTPFTIC